MQKLSKGQMIGIGVGLIALILIIVAVSKNNSTNTTTDTNPEGLTEQATSTPTSTAGTTTTNANKPVAKPAAAKVSYEDKVKQYVGRRFQINDSCQVSPAQATFTNNTAVMFDNRSPIDRVINLSGKNFTVKAKGWIEMKLTSKELPNTINVACGSAYNVAKILLQ
jgi:hypothetical protein